LSVFFLFINALVFVKPFHYARYDPRLRTPTFQQFGDNFFCDVDALPGNETGEDRVLAAVMSSIPSNARIHICDMIDPPNDSERHFASEMEIHFIPLISKYANEKSIEFSVVSNSRSDRKYSSDQELQSTVLLPVSLRQFLSITFLLSIVHMTNSLNSKFSFRLLI
jgi:hypothetical protein